MYAVYIIQNINNKYYIGVTSNLLQRLRHHNTGANRFTKKRGPWHLVYKEDFEDKKEAWLREKQIKRYKGGEAFKRLLSQHGEVA